MEEAHGDGDKVGGSSKQIRKKEEGERPPENPTQKQSMAGIGEIQQQPDRGLLGVVGSRQKPTKRETMPDTMRQGRQKSG
ncbi:hypothetical protein C2S51_017201 [Perilla frutescens var. frutescens]|nr:hypothetical protein C2S51_017201 [Perilla frutescens var. frutescens]